MEQPTILYEDNHLLVVVKEPNLLSQGDRTGDPDLLNILKEYIKVTYNKPGNVYLGLVHRLDRPVGGVMVFAKTSKSARRLSEQIRINSFGKEYLAVIWGHPEPIQDGLVDYLIKNRRSNRVRVTQAGTPGAQRAELTYKVIDMTSQYSLVRVRLHTGRSHQIRVQMANIGHPLVGDQRYGKRHNLRQQIALWAESLTFKHPTSKKVLQFVQPPPRVQPWCKFNRLT